MLPISTSLPPRRRELRAAIVAFVRRVSDNIEHHHISAYALRGGRGTRPPNRRVPSLDVPVWSFFEQAAATPINLGKLVDKFRIDFL